MIGFGYDVHQLADGETLTLGGVTIPHERGTVAHSDGDVLLHAVCDAILGAAGMGDIGEHFPDSDPAYLGVDSTELLRSVCRMIGESGYALVNIDATLVLEQPRISAHKAAMRNNIAEVCTLAPQRVSIKATTSEQLGFVGAGQGVQAHAVCLIEKIVVEGGAVNETVAAAAGEAASAREDKQINPDADTTERKKKAKKKRDKSRDKKPSDRKRKSKKSKSGKDSGRSGKSDKGKKT